MDLVPPWSLTKRQQWAEAHPLLASVYAALVGSLVPLYVAVTGSDRFAVFLLICLWLSIPLLAWGIKRRWGQRPDAEDHPRPTLRRPWRAEHLTAGSPGLCGSTWRWGSHPCSGCCRTRSEAAQRLSSSSASSSPPLLGSNVVVGSGPRRRVVRIRSVHRL
jgi:hypothetical protein